MLQKLLGLSMVLGLCLALAVSAGAADKDSKDTGDKSGKKGMEAKITKVDAKKGTVTVEIKGKDGKEHEKTFQLAEDAEYLDSTGKVATVDVFTSGDYVLVIEREGKLKQIKKQEKGKAGDESSKPSSKSGGSK